MHTKKTADWPFLIALAINLGLAISFVILGAMAVQQDLLWRADFTAFYTGGAIVRDGLGSQLYNYELQSSYQDILLGGKSFSDGLLPFNYPPHAALLFTPLALVERPLAFGLWTFIQVGLLAWLLVILWRFSNQWHQRERLLLLTGVVAFFPLLSNILLGAFSLFILNCLMSWVLTLKQGDETAAGLWLAAATFKPQTIILPGLITLLARRWRVIWAFAIGVGVIFLVSAIAFGPYIWLEFVRVLRLSASLFNEYGIYPATMYNLKGTLVVWFGSDQKLLINAISLAGFFLSIGVTGWLWRGRWQPGQALFTLRMSLTLTLSILFGLHVNPQDGLLLVAPAVIFYEFLRREDLPRTAYGVFLWSCVPVFLLSEFTIRDSLGIRMPVLAMVILLAWQVWAWRKVSEKRGESSSETGTASYG